MKNPFIKQSRADQKYWREMADAMDWRLYGWNLRHEATFITGKLVSGIDRFHDFTGKERDDIMRAIAKGGAK